MSSFWAGRSVFGQNYYAQQVHPSVLRLLVLLLIICDTIRRMFENVRPIDQWMFWIELFILAFIVWEFVWKVKDWLAQREERKEYGSEMGKRLSLLQPDWADALESLVSTEKQPDTILAMNMVVPLHGILVRDPLLGWNIAVEHRAFLRRWATERAKNRSSTF